MSLALDQTRLVPSRKVYERMEVLEELARILMCGGKLVLNLLYSVQFRDEKIFCRIMERMGLRLVEEYSGLAEDDERYISTLYVFQKVSVREESSLSPVEDLSRTDYDGLKFKRTNIRLKNARRITRSFALAGREFEVVFSAADQDLVLREEQIITQGEGLKNIHGSIEAIPKEEILANGFSRYFNGSRYVLFKRLMGSEQEGHVVIQ